MGKKINLGTSDAWTLVHLYKRASKPAYSIMDWLISVWKLSGNPKPRKKTKKYFSVDMSPFWVLSQFPCKLYPVYTRKSTKGFHCHVKVTWFNDQRNWNWKNTPVLLYGFQHFPQKTISRNIFSLNTVFPHTVSAETILFWIWKSRGHST